MSTLELKPPFTLPGVNVRFLEKVYRTAKSCWIWEAAKDPNGYGRFWFEGQMRLAHRISYQIFVGIIPSNLDVLHDCNNPSCVNPEHLKLGTHQDNMTDLALAGTHSNQKINYPTAIRMRQNGQTFQQIANYFGCSKAAVYAGFKRHDA